MSHMKIGANAYTPSFQDSKDISTKNSLDGIAFPQTKSVEHAGFTQKLNNVVCQEIYNLDVKVSAKSVQDVTKARQLTGNGEGGG